MEFFNADLLDQESMSKAVQGCDYVVHTASPVLMGQGSVDDYVIPAVNGTDYVMKAAAEFKVKRVVMTSSVAAIMYQDQKSRPESFNETHWSDEKVCDPYALSKTRAEKCAWDHQKKSGFELVTINPSVVWGETGVDTQTSIGMIK